MGRISMIATASPLDQVQHRQAIVTVPARRALSRQDMDDLRDALEGPHEYIDSVEFEKSDAERRLFDQAPEIPSPNTSWYRPLLDGAGGASKTKGPQNVVLNGEQERALFLQFNFARREAKAIRDAIGDRPASATRARKLIYWHRLSRKLRDHIARANLALVLAMAKRVRASELDVSELVSEGNMALLRAVDKFDVGRGFKFSTYACRAIIKGFSRSGMKQSQYRKMFPADYDPAMETSDYQEVHYREREQDCASVVRSIVMDNRASLSDVEQAIIHHRFALKGRAEDQSPLTLEQVGKLVGLTKERVRQIQNKALAKIRRALEHQYIDGRDRRYATAVIPTVHRSHYEQ
ncbi:MAG: hypothetical protein CMJ49_02575 [Planctomycetaceae bacterium]|nr:hypothetical protein [Planctomycetaceae bacterium]